jgi:hypothetical protein
MQSPERITGAVSRAVKHVALRLAIVPASLALAGCAMYGALASVPEACADAATNYDGEVVGVFMTTVGAIRGLSPLPSDQPKWPELSSDHSAILCYVDGAVAKAPPPGPDGEVAEPFDRLVIGIADGEAVVVVAGYRDTLEVRAP